MNNLNDAYSQIMQLYRAEGLTPEPLEGIGFSGKWTSVFGTGSQSGMAFNFTGEHEFYGQTDPMRFIELQHFIGESLTSVAGYLAEKEGVLYLNALYLAVLNALSNPLNTAERLKKRGFSVIPDSNFDFIREDDFVTVIGAGGVVNHLRKLCKEVHVSDMRPQNALEGFWLGKEIYKGPANIIFHSPEENEKLLAQSDVVLMTGSTLVNQTIFDLLPMIKKSRITGLFGPSAMLLPDYLRDLGVNFIMTSHITNTKLMKSYLLDGFCKRNPEIFMSSYSIKIS